MPSFFLEPNVPFQFINLEIYATHELFYAINKYIKNNIYKFFPKTFQDEFKNLSNLSTNQIDRANTLIEMFDKIDIERKSCIIYIFDHII